uniref:Uncharacterized protein n=1 Tax=Setaria viridis TaxID=4556 RepID=A0A4U6T8S0_SETVI|nr:hypothetical protein SEVIR_9G478150v2 [Setaria viridis]
MDPMTHALALRGLGCWCCGAGLQLPSPLDGWKGDMAGQGRKEKEGNSYGDGFQALAKVEMSFVVLCALCKARWPTGNLQWRDLGVIPESEDCRDKRGSVLFCSAEANCVLDPAIQERDWNIQCSCKKHAVFFL